KRSQEFGGAIDTIRTSPNGRYTVFLTNRKGEVIGLRERRALWLMERSSGNIESLKRLPHKFIQSVQWSPNSAGLAVELSSTDGTDIYLLDIPAGNARKWLSGTSIGPWCWHHDGR